MKILFILAPLAIFVAGLIYLCKPNENKEKLNLEQYREEVTINDDDWNKIPNGEIVRRYYDNENKEIGMISYRHIVGQIGLFFIWDDKYRNRGLGKQILNRAINDMRNNKTTSVWAITSENHTFWSNVFNKSFQWKKRPHSSVTGSGYLMLL